MSAWDGVPATAEVWEPKRDRWGRYLLPHPDTGKDQAWTRATTFAKAVADLSGLTRWEKRMVTIGLATRPDLYAQAASLDPADRKALDRVADAAKEAAAASAGANLGTALHTFTERLDRGETVAPPDPWDRDLAAYSDAMASAGVEVRPEWVERITVVPGLGVAGTLDRIVSWNGALYIADLKTGRDLSYSWGDIAIQLALYAHGSGLYVPGRDAWEPMPDVDRYSALVMHLPAGSATCTLYRVDISAGWEMAQTCGQVREWRKRKDLAAPIPSGLRLVPATATEARPEPPEDVADAAPAEVVEWLTARLAALAELGEYAKGLVVARWPDGVPKPGPWTVDHANALAEVLDTVEAHTGAPFPPADPRQAHHPTATWATPETPSGPPSAPDWPLEDPGDLTTPHHEAHVRAVLTALGEGQAETVYRWATEAKRAGRPFDRTADGLRVLHARIMEAACLVAAHLWAPDEDDPEQLPRAALRVVLGQRYPSDARWPVGVVLGSLTMADATDLLALATEYGAGQRAPARSILAAVEAEQ